MWNIGVPVGRTHARAAAVEGDGGRRGNVDDQLVDALGTRVTAGLFMSCAVATLADAAPITYTMRGVATGSLGATSSRA